MKKSILFFAVFSCITFTFIACGDTTTTAVDEPEKEQPKTEVPPKYVTVGQDEVTLAETPASCKISDYQITKECSDRWQRNYEVLGKFPRVPSEGGKLVDTKGFHIKHGEFLKIIQNNPGDFEVWAMLGVEGTNETPELVFVVENTKTNEITYYNFTRPCPDTCPPDLDSDQIVN